MYEMKKLDELIIDPTQPLFCDSETVGLYGKIRLFQAYQADWDKVALVEYPGNLELFSFLNKHHHVWHNSHYDITTLQQQLGGHPVIPDAKDFDDTFLLARLALPHRLTYNLEDVMTEALGFNPYSKLGDKKDLQKSDWGAVRLSEEQLLYAATDVKYMPEVWELVKHKLDDGNYILDKSTVKSCFKMQWNGMPVDRDRLDTEWAKTERRIAEISLPINANSYKQVREWLGVTESNKHALSLLAYRDGDTRASDIMEVRGLRKSLNFLGKYDKDRVVGKFKPSARSGRTTSDDENLQQIPRKLKHLFGYPEDAGRCLIYSDYAQLELRTICAVVQEELMEKLFRDDVDLHGYVASILFGEDWTKADRQVTKTFNFNLLYGGSAGMVCSILITYGTYMRETEANRHKSKWLKLFKSIARWQKVQISNWRKGKLGSTPFGRQYIGKLMTDQMNLANQGAGADVTKLAWHYLTPKLEAYNKTLPDEDQVLICDVIHDSFILDSPTKPEIYEHVSKMLAECMQQAWFEMSKCFAITDLPMPVDVLVGCNWGEIEAGENIIFEHKLKGMEAYEGAQS